MHKEGRQKMEGFSKGLLQESLTKNKQVKQTKPLIKQLQAHQLLTHTHIHINRTGDGEWVG